MQTTRRLIENIMKKAVAVNASDGDHYYTITGDPAYGVDIKKARAEGLLPSPSTILQVMNKPGLSIWKEKLIAETALEIGEEIKSLYREPKQQISEVLKAARAKGGEAMQLGTNIHTIAEDILNDRYKPTGHPLMDKFGLWLSDYKSQHIIRTNWTEKSVVHVGEKIAFAGRVDALVEHQEVGLAVLDWKSTKVPRSAKGTPQPKWYDNYTVQLAAYSYAIEGKPSPISVAIDTTPNTEDGIYQKIWDPLQVERGWRIFYLLYRLWCEEKKYEPHKFYLSHHKH